MTEEEENPTVSFEAHQARRSTSGGQLRRRRPSSGARLSGGSKGAGAARLKDVTKLVMKMNSSRDLFADTSSHGSSAGSHHSNAQQSTSGVSHRSGLSSSRGGHPRHRRGRSAVPYQDDIGAYEMPNASVPMFGTAPASATSLFNHAQHLENLFQTGPSDTYDDLPSTLLFRPTEVGPSIEEGEEEDEDEDANEVDWNGTHPMDVEQGEEQAAQETTNLLPNQEPQLTTGTNVFRRTNICKRCWATFTAVIPPGEIWVNLRYFLSTTFLLFMVPCAIAAAFFFYSAELSDMEFLPYQMRLSWFLLFAVRLSATFTLAQMTQWIYQAMLRTTWYVQVVGPLLALITMQSLGWPFLVTYWGIWNLILLYGDRPFVKHWMYWSGIRLFSIQYNRGNGILAAEMYGRILVSMIVLGLASATKRTFVALYLSRRMLQYYRAQLEEVMSLIKLIMEVADLSTQTDKPGFEELVKENFNQIALDRKKNKPLVDTVPTFAKTSQKMDDSSDSDDDDDSVEGADKNLDKAMDASAPVEATATDPKEIWNSLKERAMNDRDTINFAGDETKVRKRQSRRGGQRSIGRASASSISMMFLFLDRWHEPKETGRKVESPSLHDILQFKKAINFMAQIYPFGLGYGPCPNRKACVKNAVRVYRKLLKFEPDKPVLSFDVIGALAYEEDGVIDEEMAIDLLRLFFPDKDDALPMLAFVQACDKAYKQMRFLRASLSNSTKIDSVLEDIFNFVFYLVLGVGLLIICGFNPFPVLLGLSSLTVSFAFAFGPSVAKNVEGILMIAVRRPYDIGDRITLVGAQTVASTNAAENWLVEDISLTTTTLRYAATNEVATVNNSSIADARIVNFARSSKAMVSIRIEFDIDASQRQLDDFRDAMEAYTANRPRKWIGLVHYMAVQADTDSGFVRFVYRAQHVKSWQELGAIMIDKGDWDRHAEKVADDMGIIFDSPPRQMTVGVGIARELRNNKAVADRNQVAEFVRRVNSTGTGTGTGETTDAGGKVLDTISEFFGPQQPGTQAEKVLDGLTL